MECWARGRCFARRRWAACWRREVCDRLCSSPRSCAAEWNDEHRRWAPVGRAPRSQKAVARRPLAQAALVAANGGVVKPQPMDAALPAVEVEIDTTEKRSRFYEDTMEQMLTRIGASGTTRICRPPQRFPCACT